MVDETIVAARVAAIRDAVDRIRGVLPPEPETLEADRTTREVVILNLFVALQESVSLATHWLADAGLDVPGSYREIFLDLAERGESRATWLGASRQLRGFATSWPTSTASSIPPASTPSRRETSVISSISARS